MSNPPIKVLLVEDDSECANALREMLSQEKKPSFEVERAKKLQAGLERLSKGGIDVVLLDLTLPDSQGLDTLEKVQAQATEIPVIVVTGMADEMHALEVLRKGAQEYLVKGEIHGRMLSRVIRYAIERIHAERRAKAERLRSDRLARRLEQVVRQLKEAQEEMLRREKALATGELAAGVAHEIRNPLSIISMSVQYLQSKFPVRDARREFTEAIIRKVEHLDRITKRLLSFGRRRELSLKRQSIQVPLNRVISLFKVKCKTQGVKVIKRYRKKLPRVLLDEEAIEEIYSNLFSNALEAMPRGGRLEIRTAYDRLSQAVTVRISDTGSGIQKKLRHHLFQPFFSTKKERGGSGLGLAISNRIASDHGGSITVGSRTSGPHRGTSFIVQLPVKIPEAELSSIRSSP